MSEQTPAEQPLDIITQLTVRPASTGWNTPTAVYGCTGLRWYIRILYTYSYYYPILINLLKLLILSDEQCKTKGIQWCNYIKQRKIIEKLEPGGFVIFAL